MTRRKIAPTPHQAMEADLTALGLSWPETDIVQGWGPTRYMRVRKKGFAVFGDKDEPAVALTLIFKLPGVADMVADLPFVRDRSDWFRKHEWVIAHFGPGDDIEAQRDTLRAWLVQSYAAVAPKKLGAPVLEAYRTGLTARSPQAPAAVRRARPKPR
jgi:hypothetical protein